ncbi:MAG: family 78 glycoside hydrolase catalytic domain [Clostridia bacterium]|nr:family 78 glycoside hydrolase catalytic domain [Clostridia bacterium]
MKTDIHTFSGKWITNKEFENLSPRNVFHRQLENVNLPCDEHRNRHILFRKNFYMDVLPENAVLYITADDYYKLYINGEFVTQGPAPSYNFSYGYNTVDVTPFLREGENTVAVHTLYQGLINRVWVSADNRHGLLCDLVADGKVIIKSDESFLTHPHTAYTETGFAGYQTQFLEEYDSSASEVGFEAVDFDDSYWQKASYKKNTDYSLEPQPTKRLVFEKIQPVNVEKRENTLFIDFGACYVGYLAVKAIGKKGDTVIVRCGQELNDDLTVRYDMRCNCKYEEPWRLSGNEDILDWFDYKSFRYAELVLPENCEVEEIYLTARHYPFELKAKMNPEFEKNFDLKRIWELCIHSQKYGVQEVIQDCMDREKGFYLGDGCYTALANMILTGDDSIVRKLIDDAFKTSFITPTLVTCMDCSFMQEIAEYPLYMVSLILWHYRLTKDKEYLKKNYSLVCRLLNAYKAEYEKDYLLQELDKWCVVEWPNNFRDGYDVDISEGKICHEPHIAMNAFYIEAIRCANIMAKELNLIPYRDEAPLIKAFQSAFRDSAKCLYRDSSISRHISYIGNVYTYAFCLYANENDKMQIEKMIEEKGITSVMLFGAFPLLYGFVRNNRFDLFKKALLDKNAWLRMLSEGATTTFEGWGKDSKWNISLFHLTFSYAAVFLSDVDLKSLFSAEI